MKWRHEVLPSDLPAIRAMVAGTGVFSAEEIDVAVELAEDRLNRGESSDYIFLLAELDGTLAGYTCFGRIPFTDARYDLYWIVVDKSAQTRGIASELMRGTEVMIRKAGGKMLYADTSSRIVYEPAHSFYRKHGLSELARLKGFYADGDDKLVFGKSL